MAEYIFIISNEIDSPYLAYFEKDVCVCYITGSRDAIKKKGGGNFPSTGAASFVVGTKHEQKTKTKLCLVKKGGGS